MGSIVESRLKELHPVMPVMFIKAVTQDKQELRDDIQCCCDIRNHKFEVLTTKSDSP